MFLFKNRSVWIAFLETESMCMCVCGGGGGQEMLSEIVTPRYLADLAEGTDSKTVP